MVSHVMALRSSAVCSLRLGSVIQVGVANIPVNAYFTAGWWLRVVYSFERCSPVSNTADEWCSFSLQRISAAHCARSLTRALSSSKKVVTAELATAYSPVCTRGCSLVCLHA